RRPGRRVPAADADPPARAVRRARDRGRGGARGGVRLVGGERPRARPAGGGGPRGQPGDTPADGVGRRGRLGVRGVGGRAQGRRRSDLPYPSAAPRLRRTATCGSTVLRSSGRDRRLPGSVLTPEGVTANFLRMTSIASKTRVTAGA